MLLPHLRVRATQHVNDESTPPLTLRVWWMKSIVHNLKYPPIFGPRIWSV